MVAGAILILAGILTLIAQFSDFTADVFMLALAAIFLVAGLLARKIGLIIPGGILAGLGVGQLLIEGPFKSFEGIQIGGIFMVCFAGGWLLISLLSVFADGKFHSWPLIPGSVLALFGLALLAGEMGQKAIELAGRGWPLVLIAVGLYLLLRRKETKPE
jgi:hypothetical protein